MTERPDHWIVIEFEDGLRKVLAGWRGSFLGGESWRLNSGIVSTEEHEEYFVFYGYSGSVYECLKSRYGCNPIMQIMLNKFVDQLPSLKILELKDVS